ncbi:DUF3489 domain-containing protein [Sinisalibacter aestuarii]|uniref:DUF3489 domain-containing protein n=1 Tax=Sinisalibacter aestuarii TaxID=2949426 RepID=UPI0024901CF9|nr:DUF3489 domain-containing protein [Sinisalibacter aestuarii]
MAAKEEDKKNKRQDVLDRLERMGVPIPKDSKLRNWRPSGLDFARDTSVTGSKPGRTPGASRYQGQPSSGPENRGANMSKSTSTPPRETKTAILRKLLSRKAGADLDALQSATGWQPHSVRAAMSGLRKAGYTIDRADPAKTSSGAVYRITSGPESAT